MKNRSRVIIMTAVLLIGIALWLPGLRSRRVAAQSAGLTGSYGFTQTDLSNPSATVGVITFDGAGNVTGSVTSVQPDPSPNATAVVVQAGQFTGTYTVNPDGTGTLTLQLGGPTPNTSSFVITDGGSGLMFVNTGGGGKGNDLRTGTA